MKCELLVPHRKELEQCLQEVLPTQMKMVRNILYELIINQFCYVEFSTFDNCFVVPSSSPVFHSCTNITSTSIKLQWDKVPSNHQNGVILGYHIRYRPSFGNGSWNETVVRQENQTYLIVNNLTMYSWYIFRISAFTRKGEGKESKRELLTDEYGKD